MSIFERTMFRQEAEYIKYNGKFVARFKYQKSAMGSFIKFLRENFTVEEYFGRMEAGEPPLKIVQSKGYLLPHVRRILRQHGYPETVEGFNGYIKDMARKRA
jgi:hypothetical protein